MAKRLTSIFTDDMDTCIFTGSTLVERHHVFAGAARRNKCEEYGFVVPIRYDLHPNGARFDKGVETMVQIDNYLKEHCQKWYEENIGSRDDFIREFGKSYL